MLTIACNSFYKMDPLDFFAEAKHFSENLNLKSKNFENTKKDKINLHVGSVIARVGFLPQLVQTFLGMLHFGIIIQEKTSSVEDSFLDLSDRVFQFNLNNSRASKYFFLKREFFDRFRIQHYEKKKNGKSKKQL